MPSTAARARFSGVALVRVRPLSVPVASGRSGVRSPSRYGSRLRPPAPGPAWSASRSRVSRSTPIIAAVALSTRAALSVQESGRWPPVASAKPAMAPVSSRIGSRFGVKTVPLVPSETTTSPGVSASPSAAPMLSPVPAATSMPPAVRPAAADGASTSGTLEDAAEGHLEQVGPVLVGGRREVAGARRVAAVGAPALEAVAVLEDPAGQPVVGQHDPGDPRRVVGLVRGEPAQLGHGEAGDRHEVDLVDPRTDAPELGGEVGSGLRAAGVVPQQRLAHDLVALVEGDHAVLLPADGDGRDTVESAAPAGQAEGLPPPVGVHLGAVRVRRARRAHHLTGVGVADDDLRRLGRAVDSGNEGAVAHRVVLHGADVCLTPRVRWSCGRGRVHADLTRVCRQAREQPPT